MPRRPKRLQRAIAALTLICSAMLLTVSAMAAPEAHLLRVDPRASQQTGDPVITTVIELVQSRRVSDATASCATARGDAQLNCMSEALGRPNALYQSFPFPSDNAIFTVSVDGSDSPAKFISHATWGDSQREPGVGTAWLILIDADARMGRAFDDAKQVAARFIASMAPNDIVDVMLFNDRQVVQDSKWVNSASKAKAQAALDSVSSTYRSQGRNRPLLSIIQTAATDAFKALGNVGVGVDVPMHQAMIVLSSGFGGADPKTTGPGALQLRQYMTQGRFPEDNTALPKLPVPVISVFFPPRGFDEVRQNSLEFMRDMANTEIGGYFTILRDGQGGRADEIVKAVRTRFSKMHLVKWRVSCVAPTITQSFKLVFNNVEPPIAGDTTFKDVPVGIDPSTWPLDVDVKYTQDLIGDGVYPGGTFKVYGNFCWGGDKTRAEVYFLPAGQAPPAELKGNDIGKAKEAQKRLIATGMRGTVLQTADTFAEFQAPDKDKIIHGSGSQGVVRAVLYDNKARRTSGVTADTILQLKATSAPFPLVLILGGLLGLVVLLLLVVLVMRSGGSKRRAAATPRRSVVGAGPYPAPAPTAPAAPPPAYDASGVKPHPSGIQRVHLDGSAGLFTLQPGVEVRAGRDGNQCTVLMTEPRVSSVHASLKIEGKQLLLRDENSNNGTLVNGAKVNPGAWVPVANGATISFGPVQFNVKFE